MKKKEKIYNTIDYLWKENGIHPKCKNCIHKCKQHGKLKIINCPKFNKK